MSFKKIFLKVMLTLVAVISFAGGALASDTADSDCGFDESLLIREISRFTSRDPEVFKVNDSIQNGDHPLMWEVLKCLNDLMDKYPNVTSAIRWLKRYHGDKLGKTFEITLEHMVKAPADTYWSYACVRGNFSVIVLNDIFWGQGFDEEVEDNDFAKGRAPGWTFHALCEASVNERFWFYCKKEDYIKKMISHEFGHVVEMVFACLVTYADSRPEYAEYYGKSYDEICDLVRKHILYDGGTKWCQDTSESGGDICSDPITYMPFNDFMKLNLPADENTDMDKPKQGDRYYFHLGDIVRIYNEHVCTHSKINAQEFFAEMFSYAQCNELGKLSWADGNPYLAKAIHDFVNSIIMPAIPDEHTTPVRGVISVWNWLTSWF